MKKNGKRAFSGNKTEMKMSGCLGRVCSCCQKASSYDRDLRILQLRIYTAEFGRNILGLYEKWLKLPAEQRGDLRCRRSVPEATKRSDREIFETMEMGDLWIDSSIHQVFLYLYGCRYCETLACP